MNPEAKQWIERLELEPHPEGGYYRRIYESDLEVHRPTPDGSGSETLRAGSSIYYLLPAGEASDLHRLASDETWHFYRGAPLRLHLFAENGEKREYVLGEKGVKLPRYQFTVPAGTWFGAQTMGAFSFVGCTVFPEFRFEDFELADPSTLKQQFPDYHEFIDQLTS